MPTSEQYTSVNGQVVTMNVVARTYEEYNQQWTSLNWQEIEHYIFKLQTKIYKSTQDGNFPLVKNLQKLIISSWRSRLLAVRQVTQDNPAKKTAEIQGKVALNPQEKIIMAENLRLTAKAKPSRRICISKPEGQKSSLSIPTIEEKAKQALVKLALEPEWEAKFEPNSFGFRPGRCCYDAISAIYNSVQGAEETQWILSAHIEGCFAQINHQYLLNKLNCAANIRKQIKAWLKAGAIEWFTETDLEIPQAGIILPLLVNIALHGLENRLKQWLWQEENYRIQKGENGHRKTKATLKVIRYAENFVIIHPDKYVLEKSKKVVQDFFREIGVELREAKIQSGNIDEGIDFLGFNIRRYKTGKYRGDKTPDTVLCKPSREAVFKHYHQLRKVVKQHQASSQETLIKNLTPIIRGWTNYFKFSSAEQTFSRLDMLLFRLLKNWCIRRHPNKGKKWAIQKYYPDVKEKGKWIFRSDSYILPRHSQTLIRRHTIVEVSKSPYNGNTAYWSQRMNNYGGYSNLIMSLLKKQQGKCNYCQNEFRIVDIIEIDHKIPQGLGGKSSIVNYQLLHRHCYNCKTRENLRSIVY